MKTKKLVYCALFAALVGIASLISIPIQPIPVNMGILTVLLAGGLLGKKYGTISIIVYIFMGILGVPVFAGFRGGVSIIVGPTGGYIMGYLIIAFLTGWIYEKTKKARYTVPVMIISILLCYFVGTLWYCYILDSGFIPALTLCVLPFIPGDALKIVLAVLLLKKYRL